MLASLRRYLVMGAVLTLCAGWVLADITIVQPVGANYDESDPLTGLPVGATGTVMLNPAGDIARLAPPAGGSNFANTFTADVAQYPGWTMATGGSLAGTVTINFYTAHDYGEPRGGADLKATYAKAAAEAAIDFAWIQMFTDNTGAGGALVRHVDPFPNDGTDGGPFYYNSDEGITSLVFEDHPSDAVTSIPFHRTVRFETYLSSFNNTTKVVTIHDGFAWGYDVDAVPEPVSLVMLMGLPLVLRRRSR